MDNNQQQNGKQIPLIIDAVPNEVPDDLGQHPNTPRAETWWDKVAGIFRGLKYDRERISPHAGGRTKPKNYRAKRKTRRQMARASRRRNRGK